MIRNILGILLLVLAIPVGLYVGVWLCFILGIVQVIEAIKATPVEAMGVAVGIFRIIGAVVIGIFSVLVMIVPGYAMVASAYKKYSGSSSSFRRRR
jgi:hypothetical protein